MLKISTSTLVVVAILLAGAGCHFDMDSVPFLGSDRDATVDSGPPGDTTGSDVWSQPDKLKIVDLEDTDHGCALGTPDHCEKCGNKCPGKDDASTKRVCVNGKCNIVCRGNHYDINGSVGDGCEYNDPHAGYGSQNTAKHLGNATDCDPAKSTVSSLPSDLRYHEQAPHTRVLGPQRWFKLVVKDKVGCFMDFKLTLDATSLPAGALYELDPLYLCNNTNVLGLKSKTGKGSTVITMAPLVKCTAGSDDGGTMFVKVRKFSGTSVHSTKPFKVSIKP